MSVYIKTRGNVQILRWTFHVSKQTRTLEISGKFVDNVPSTLQLFCRGKQRVREGRRVLREYSTPILIFLLKLLIYLCFQFLIAKNGSYLGPIGPIQIRSPKIWKMLVKKIQQMPVFSKFMYKYFVGAWRVLLKSPKVPGNFLLSMLLNKLE